MYVLRNYNYKNLKHELYDIQIFIKFLINTFYLPLKCMIFILYLLPYHKNLTFYGNRGQAFPKAVKN